DHEGVFADVGTAAGVDIPEEVQPAAQGLAAAVTVKLEQAADMRPAGNEHGGELSCQPGPADVRASPHASVENDAHRPVAGDLAVQYLARQAVAGDAQPEHTAQLVLLLEHLDCIAEPGQVVG